MAPDGNRDPLHGVTLEMIVTRLAEYWGWERLGQFIDLRCFTHDPSVSSSLKFLRRTPWARKRVEEFYVKYRGNPWVKDPLYFDRPDPES